MSASALPEAGALSTRARGSNLATTAAMLVAVLACAACQPETAANKPGQPAGTAPAPQSAAPAATPAAPAAPVPPEPGQVTEGTNLDLKPQVTEKVISTDASGTKMAVERSGTALKLTMPKVGLSRAQLSAVLDPGEYDVHLVTGAVEVKEKAPEGLGAFFGPENDRAASVELKPNADQRVRISVPTKRRVFFALGFGGWGKAGGSAEIKTLEIVKAPKA